MALADRAMAGEEIAPTAEDLLLTGRRRGRHRDVRPHARRQPGLQPRGGGAGRARLHHAPRRGRGRLLRGCGRPQESADAGDVGTSFIGVQEYGAGLFYLYACVDCDLLGAETLGGDRGARAGCSGRARPQRCDGFATRQAGELRLARPGVVRPGASAARSSRGRWRPRSSSRSSVGGDVRSCGAIRRIDAPLASASNLDRAYGACADDRRRALVTPESRQKDRSTTSWPFARESHRVSGLPPLHALRAARELGRHRRGRVRGSWDRPSRSAVLGLRGGGARNPSRGAGGARRAGRRLWHRGAARRTGYAARRTTTQRKPWRASIAKQRRPATRAELLAAAPGDRQTILSRRVYRQDALATVALWERSAAPRWSLGEVQRRYLRPQFVLYAGRKGECVRATARARCYSRAVAWRRTAWLRRAAARNVGRSHRCARSVERGAGQPGPAHPVTPSELGARGFPRSV